MLSRFEYFRIQMGTRVRIVLYAGSEAVAREAAAAAFERIQQLDEMMSDYNPESELMRLCREAVEVPRPVSPDLFVVLEKSRHFSEISGGAFDITVGPVVSLWREARRRNQLPEKHALDAARTSVGYANVVLDSGSRAVLLKRTGMKLDLGGIAAGYAVDQALAVLAARGIQRALVDAGGDIGTGLAPPDQPGWRVTIQIPRDGRLVAKELIVRQRAITTSGDAEQFLEMNGIRYSHIVDPKTGFGIIGSASVTVIAPEATTADALATALSVLPPEAGLRLADSQPGVAALILRRLPEGLRSYTSRRMKQYWDVGLSACRSSN